MTFDPNQAAAPDSGIFGLPTRAEGAAVVLVPVPWEVTTSYGAGTANGPNAILRASRQLDLYDHELLGRVYEPGIAMLDEANDIRALNDELRAHAEAIIAAGGAIEGDADLEDARAKVNDGCAHLNEWVRDITAEHIERGQIVGIVGGDHAVPFGGYKAAADAFGSFGVLHIDAHSDTRLAYEGFAWSHASIMRNALERISDLERIVQVGIRDYCEEELAFLRSEGSRARVFFDLDLAARKADGEPWRPIAREIVEALPERVWLSVDIDGLERACCPNTGTPVPGGLSFHETLTLLAELGRSGRRIVGFDLVEVAPAHASNDEWDANVAMRLLYKMCGWALVSQGKLAAPGLEAEKSA